MSKKTLKAIYGLVLCIGLLAQVLTPLPSWAQEPRDVTINYIEARRVPEIPPNDVYAYVTVSDAEGMPVTGIDPANFTVLEDTKKMPITEVAKAVDSMAVTLVLDTSDSMRLTDTSGKVPIDEAKKAAVDFIWSLDDQDQVAVFSFNEEVTLERDFTTDHGAAINAVNRLATEQKWTCLYDAAFEAVEKAAEIPEGRRAVVLLTDGKDQIDSQGTPCSKVTLEDVIDLAQRLNIPTYTIGLGNEQYLDPQALERLAKLTGGRSLFAPTSAELQKLFEIISSQLKNQYVIKYRSEAASAGYYNLKVKVQHRGWQGDDQKGFYPPSIPTIVSVTASPPGSVTQGEAVSI
jgi:VWFA-related protein